MKELTERISVILFVVLVFAGMNTSITQAQSTAQVNGRVTDQTGAVLPGVEVAATQTATGVVRNAVTDETGSYILQNLPLGPYRLEASLPGFRTYAQSGIVLQVGSNPTINAVLEVGQVTETVEVQANAVMVETRSTGVGQVMENVRVLELPLGARQVTDLILLSGATVGGDSRALTRHYPTIAVSVGGGSDNALTYRLDGGTHNDPYNNLNMPLPFPDALQEFKVETSALPAEYGGHSGGAISAVTKSGTNEFHGSLFEFVRNEIFNAKNAFALERDSLKRNQFGGTAGGPILKNKLFFFGGYQGTTERSAASADRVFIPTAAMLAGDFTTVASTACRSNPVTLGSPFVNNRIDPALISTVARNIVKQLPTTNDPCGEVRFGHLIQRNENIYVGRVDYQRSDSHSLFARYTLHQSDEPSDYDGKTILSFSKSAWFRRYQSAVVGDTYLVGSNIVNTFRATFLRGVNEQPAPQDFFTLPEMGAKGVWYPENYPKMMLLSIDGGFGFSAATATPSFTNTTAFEFSDSFSWVRGAHQVGFGANFGHQKMNVSASSYTPGQLNFRSSTGIGLGDFLLGRVDQWQQMAISTWYPRQNLPSAYFQDTWKATPRFTVNLGLRWEPYLPQWRKDNQHLRFKREWFDQGIKSQVYTNAPAGVLYSGDPGMPKNNKISDNSWLQFGPRVGLALDPHGDGQMVIRAAYGIFFDYPHMYQFNGYRAAPPFENRVIRTNVPLDDPWQGYAGGSPYPFSVTANAPFFTEALFINDPEKIKPTYAHQWNLSIQRQIGANWMVAANYLGNSVIHFLVVTDLNAGVYIPGSTASLASRRILSLADPVKGRAYGNLNTIADDGTRNYNALWLQLQYRHTRGLTVTSNYTWSHCISDADNTLSQQNGYGRPERRGANRGNCVLDLRHSFNMTTVYETPRFANSVLRVLASNWSVSGIAKLTTGEPLTVSCGCDNARTGERSGGASQRAQQVLGDPYAPNKSIGQWLNPAAFISPAVGTYGNAGVGNIRGPGHIVIDMGLTRKIRMGETKSLEFRAEALNMPNHVNPGNPATAITSSDFGRISSAGDERIMQFALKYVF